MFIITGRLESQALGMPDLAIVIVTHPMVTEPKAVTKKAEDILDDLSTVLTMPLEQLTERAKQQSRGSARI
ncbi:hypothetical protein ACFLUZ_00765 [Chloroflexota bacterium]